MKRIQMKSISAGPGRPTRMPGQVVEVSDGEAKDLVAGGFGALAGEGAADVETAENTGRETAETTVSTGGKRRGNSKKGKGGKKGKK